MTVRLQTLFETPAKERLTAQEYLDHPLSERKSDLIEGVFVMASPASFQHEELIAFLLATLSAFVGYRKLGRVLSSNAAYRLSGDNVYQPDVSFVAAERAALRQETVFPGPPDIAVEVVSPSSRQYDTVEKKINYGRYGVGEYWLIDPTRRARPAPRTRATSAPFFTPRQRATCCPFPRPRARSAPRCSTATGWRSPGSSPLKEPSGPQCWMWRGGRA